MSSKRTVLDAALGWLREQWDGPIVVKGIQTTDDALRAVEAGADAVVLSNHGGRQLDRSPAPLLLVGQRRQHSEPAQRCTSMVVS
jgi:isopentenyl diphosphate isomerase/L-lactate dehydrogenase-like FMN-dependent dehydrogenase